MRLIRPRTIPALTLLLLTVSPSVRAVPITETALGTITRDTGSVGAPGPQPYRFTVGESVSLTYTYDPEVDPLDDLGGSVPLFRIATGSGFTSTRSGFFFATVALAPGGGLERLMASGGMWTALLRFPDGGSAGTFTYNRDLGIGDEGFAATVTRGVADGPSPTPEPSTLAMGLVGAGLMALMRFRPSVEDDRKGMT